MTIGYPSMDFSLGKLLLTRQTSLKELQENHDHLFALNLVLQNGPYVLVNLLEVKEDDITYALLLSFKNGFLERASISLMNRDQTKFGINSEDQKGKLLEDIFNKHIGKKMDSQYGKVEYVFDPKAYNYNIVISYK
jgi:hypothetical protein